jgi:anhydro-N-acetylmuramic acid kinase
MGIAFPTLRESTHDTSDLLHTFSCHIAAMVADSVARQTSVTGSRMLITGGGAFNDFLTNRIREHLEPVGITVEVPDPKVVKYKEALAMALIGALRWRGDTNVLASVTGASRDSVGGCLWTV